jgi:NAD(P)-dependent dehydrogenase (short-subunit alcohol dehydrogenase family)
MTRFAFEAEGDEIVAAIPMGRSGLPEDAIGVAVMLASRAGAWMTGTVIPVDGGYSTLR